MPDKNFVQEYSAGGVVYRRHKGEYEVALVGRDRYGDWSLPKGHIEKGETREQAAIREVKEETGLDAAIMAPLEDTVYFFRTHKGELVRKTVHHFLMETEGHRLREPDWEVSETRWVPLHEAAGVLTYENDKKIMDKARAMLEEQAQK